MNPHLARTCADDRSRSLLLNIIDSYAAIIFAKDIEGRFILSNRLHHESLGHTRQEVLGQTDADFFPLELAKGFFEEDREVLSTGRVTRLEKRIPFANGIRDYLGLKFVLRGEDGEPYGVCGIMHDITERKRAEQALARREAELRAILDSISELMLVFDIKGNILQINPEAAARLGGSCQELVGRCIYDILPDHLAEQRRRYLEQVANTGAGLSFLDERGGKTYEHSLSPALGEQGEVEKVAVFVRDRTEEVRALHELRESESRFRQLADRLPDAIWLVNIGGDEDRRPLFISQAIHDLLGEIPPGLYEDSRHWRKLVHPEDLQLFTDAVEGRLAPRAGGSLFDIEYRLMRPDGQVRWARTQGFYVLDESGRPYRLGGVTSDITERKQLLEALNLRDRALETSQTPISMSDTQGKVRWANRAAWQQWGYGDMSEVLGLDALCFWESPAPARDFTRQVLKNGSYSGELVARRRDGTTFPVLVTANVLEDGNGQFMGLMGSYLDISDRKRAEAELRRAHDHLEETVQRRTAELSCSNQALRLQLVANAAAVDLANDLLGESLTSEHMGRLLLRRALELTSSAEGLVSIGAPQEPGARDASLSLLTSPGLEAARHSIHQLPLLTTASQGRPWHGRVEEIREPLLHALADRANARWLMIFPINIDREHRACILLMQSLRPYSDKDLKGIQLLAGIFSLAQRRHFLEQRTLQARAELERKHRLESLGTMANGIAHDFRNIMASMTGYVELILRDQGLAPKSRARLAAVIKAGRSGAELSERILMFGRRQPNNAEPIRPAAIVRDIVKMLAPCIPSGVELSIGIDEDCDPVSARPVDLHQIILNLVTNSAQALEAQGGTIGVNLHCGPLPFHDGCGGGPFLTLEVVDDGPGMDDETKARAFDPYFTTRGSTSGTGLGLWLVRGIVEELGGKVDLKSAPGQGARVRVFIPCAITDRV